MNSTVAVIATRNGQDTISETIRSILDNGIPCIVVSNGSTDATAERAAHAGATVLELAEGIGKPRSLRHAMQSLRLSEQYDWVLVVDDDTRLGPGFGRAMVEELGRGTSGVPLACIVGNTQSDYPATGKTSWNPINALRAVAFWRYSFIRQGKAALGAIDVIAGSNSLFRSTVLDELLARDCPLIVDDTAWMWWIHREQLGKIAYAHDAVAYTQDPSNLRDWVKQERRWLTGTWQGVLMGRPGRHMTKFDAVFIAQMLDWCLYVFGLPALLTVLFLAVSPGHTLFMCSLGMIGWTAAAAIALKRPRLIVHIPAMFLLDLVYRVVFVVAIVSALRQPTVSECVWDSPARKGTSNV